MRCRPVGKGRPASLPRTLAAQQAPAHRTSPCLAPRCSEPAPCLSTAGRRGPAQGGAERGQRGSSGPACALPFQTRWLQSTGLGFTSMLSGLHWSPYELGCRQSSKTPAGGTEKTPDPRACVGLHGFEAGKAQGTQLLVLLKDAGAGPASRADAGPGAACSAPSAPHPGLWARPAVGGEAEVGAAGSVCGVGRGQGVQPRRTPPLATPVRQAPGSGLDKNFTFTGSWAGHGPPPGCAHGNDARRGGQPGAVASEPTGARPPPQVAGDGGVEGMGRSRRPHLKGSAGSVESHTSAWPWQTQRPPMLMSLML